MAKKVNFISQANLLDGQFARMESKPADLAKYSEHIHSNKKLQNLKNISLSMR